MLIAQISDLHIVEPGRKTFGVAPMEENLVQVINHISQLNLKPDVVLITGDITNKGSLIEAENAARLLEGLDFPYFIIPGNHDDRDTIRAQFAGTACPSGMSEFINYVVEGSEIRLIGMDSTIANASGGELCDARLAWLDERLSEQPHQPTIIFMHHPPIKCGVLESDADGFIGADRFAEIVEKYSCIERILCGHIHLPTHSRFHGTIVSTAPSIGIRLGLDLTMTRESEFYLGAPGYQLHHWTKYKNLITHTVHLNNDDGPYEFKEHQL